MKRYLQTTALLAMALSLTGCGQQGRGPWPWILLIFGLLLAAFSALRVHNFIQYRNRQRKKGRRGPKKPDILTQGVCILSAVLLILSVVLFLAGGKKPSKQEAQPEYTPSAEPVKEIPFQAKGAESTDPDNWQIRWEIFQNGTISHTYNREDPISFGDPEDYFALPGVGTFRGNNYRDSATYGTADVQEKTLNTAWTAKTGVLAGSTWSGNGWTGQPLIVKWDDATKQCMNLKQDKKDKADLVEVIYASLDGKIYFLDLEDGSQTRPTIDVGMCFKGAGSLDPRGYPLLYVGSGDVNSQNEPPRMFIISLIDGTILYEYGHNDPLSYRKDNDNWSAFDSAPLVSADTDTLIWPGENGILYTMKLNTVFDKTAKTISVTPEAPVVTRYLTERTNQSSYWAGYEASASIVENYLYVSENGGMFYCIDLNTMELVWAQDTKDDSNSSPVFERKDKIRGYVYTAPSLHWTKNSQSKGTISIYKLDAVTGEIVWEKPYNVHTVEGVSGGVQSTPMLGKEGTNLEGMIIYSIARTDKVGSGTLVALDTATGEEIWSLPMSYYPWSSPTAVYDKDGTGYIIQCDSKGTMFFIDGATGTVVDKQSLGGLVEASPAVYEDTVVVGTRLMKIYGIKVK